MKQAWQAVIVTALCALLGTEAHGQQSRDTDPYEMLRVGIPAMKTLVIQSLDKSEGDFIRDIYIYADPRGSTNAVAYKNQRTGRREIVIFAGLAQMFEQLGIYFLATQTNLGCAQDFLISVYQRWQDNTNRVIAGLPLLGNEIAPHEFFGGRPQCASIDRRFATPSTDDVNFDLYLINTSLMIVLLHECAHHVLHHVDNPPRSLAESRDQEDQADIWALKRLSRTGFDPYYAVAFVGHAVMTGGATLEDESHATHPLGSRRVLRMLDAVLASTTDDAELKRIRELRDQIANMIR
jgi:hypothetical protein